MSHQHVFRRVEQGLWLCSTAGCPEARHVGENVAHEHIPGDTGCFVTKAEAAELAKVSARTIDNWASSKAITKYTVGAPGYWVRFCRHEILEASSPRAQEG